MAARARLDRSRPHARAAGLRDAVRHAARDRRADGPRHLAERCPGRPERRQPGQASPAIVPRVSDYSPCSGHRVAADFRYWDRMTLAREAGAVWTVPSDGATRYDRGG